MQIRETAVATPDKPAVILYPTGTVVDIRRAGSPGQPAGALLPRSTGWSRATRSAILMENNEHMHADHVGGAAAAGSTTCRSTPISPPAEAAYIIDNSGAKAIVGSAGAAPRCCDGPGRAAARRTARRCCSAPPMTWTAGRTTPMSSPISPITPIDDEMGGRPAAVLLGHHRPPEGHQARAAAPAAVGGPGDDGGAGRPSG